MSNGFFITSSNLHQKSIPPFFEVLEGCDYINIVHKYTTIRASIKSRSKAMKSFLPSCIPNLIEIYRKIMTIEKQSWQEKGPRIRRYSSRPPSLGGNVTQILKKYM
jgi:hypothetical protein